MNTHVLRALLGALAAAVTLAAASPAAAEPTPSSCVTDGDVELCEYDMSPLSLMLAAPPGEPVVTPVSDSCLGFVTAPDLIDTTGPSNLRVAFWYGLYCVAKPGEGDPGRTEAWMSRGPAGVGATGTPITNIQYRYSINKLYRLSYNCNHTSVLQYGAHVDFWAGFDHKKAYAFDNLNCPES